MTIEEKMHAGELYVATDEELMQKQAKALELQYEYNNTSRQRVKKERDCFEKCLLRSEKDAISSLRYTLTGEVVTSTLVGAFTRTLILQW